MGDALIQRLSRTFLGAAAAAAVAATGLLMASSAAAAPPAPGVVPDGATRIEDTAQLHILTPALQDRKSVKLRLANGLRLYLISDPGASQSAVAVGVRAGAWQEPAEAPGLAHFLEHMLFMGSENFPQEDGFSKFLAGYNGSANATTGLDRTVYMMQLGSDGLPGALDRLADFFVAPMLRTEALARERVAIDQELRGAASFDTHREQMVRARLSHPGHPHVYSSEGTQAVLGRISSPMLRHWFEAHYSANLMTLVVMSPLPLQTLQDLSVRAFARVPNRNLPAPHFETPLLRDDLGGKLVYIEPRANVSRRMSLQWEIPFTLADDRESWPVETLAYTLNQAGEGSLTAVLRDAGWIEDLSVYSYRQGTGSAQMMLNLALTDLGVAHRQDVLQRVFDGLAQLRQEGISESIWQLMRTQNIRDYVYQERDTSMWAVHDLAHRLVDSTLPSFPDPLTAPINYDASKIAAVLDTLTAARCHFYLIAPAEQVGLQGDVVEPEMGAHYTVRPLPAACMTQLQNATPAHYVWVTPNPFLPRSLAVLPLGSDPPTLAHPARAADDAGFTLLWARDVHALTPHVAWRFVIKTPVLRDASARHLALADLYVAAINRALAKTDENASQAGMSFDVRALDTGLQVNISGYSDGAVPLLAEVLRSMRQVSTDLTPASFALAKAHVQQVYDAHGKTSPFDDLSDVEESVTHLHPVPKSARATTLVDLTEQDLREFAATVLSTVHVQGSLVGNMDQALAAQAYSTLQQNLQALPYAEGKSVRPRLRNMTELTTPVVIRRSTAAPSSLVSLSLYAGKDTPRNYVASQVLQQFLSSRFFDALRTKQQTGYLVQSGADASDGHVLYEFIVQPEHHSVDEVLQRIESFVSDSVDNPLDPSEFEQIKASVLQELRAPPTSVGSSASRLYDLAFRRHGNFAFYEQAAAALESLSYDDFSDWNDALLDPSNPHRVVILMKGSRDTGARTHTPTKN